MMNLYKEENEKNLYMEKQPLIKLLFQCILSQKHLLLFYPNIENVSSK